jgi:hypothetical protein
MFSSICFLNFAASYLQFMHYASPDLQEEEV